jgi:hypothetical protein
LSRPHISDPLTTGTERFTKEVPYAHVENWPDKEDCWYVVDGNIDRCREKNSDSLIDKNNYLVLGF